MARAHAIAGRWMIALRHCPVCGCSTGWVRTGESDGRIGVNAWLEVVREVCHAQSEVLLNSIFVKLSVIDSDGFWPPLFFFSATSDGTGEQLTTETSCSS